MKSKIKNLAMMLAIATLMFTLVACGGADTNPDYTAKQASHKFSSSYGLYTKRAETGLGAILVKSGKTLNEIIEEYVNLLKDDFYAQLNDSDAYTMMQADNDRMAYVFNHFTGGQKFKLSPNAQNKHTGTMDIIGMGDAIIAEDIGFVINSENGKMTFIDPIGWYGKSYISYSYKDGAMYVEINVAHIILELAFDRGINPPNDAQIAQFWIQFTLS